MATTLIEMAYARNKKASDQDFHYTGEVMLLERHKRYKPGQILRYRGMLEDSDGLAVCVPCKKIFGEWRVDQLANEQEIPIEKLKQWQYREVRIHPLAVIFFARPGTVWIPPRATNEFQVMVYGDYVGAKHPIFYGEKQIGHVQICGYNTDNPRFQDQKYYFWCMPMCPYEGIYSAVTHTLMEAIKHINEAFTYQEVPEFNWD